MSSVDPIEVPYTNTEILKVSGSKGDRGSVNTVELLSSVLSVHDESPTKVNPPRRRQLKNDAILGTSNRHFSLLDEYMRCDTYVELS